MTIQEKALELHEKWNGKLETVSKTPVKSREDLSLAYTPGVAEPCKVIAQDKEAAYKYTMKANTVAVVSDGSAVLGLGNIGPYAAMPGTHLPGYTGYRRNHQGCYLACACLRRNQSGRYLSSPLF